MSWIIKSVINSHNKVLLSSDIRKVYSHNWVYKRSYRDGIDLNIGDCIREYTCPDCGYTLEIWRNINKKGRNTVVHISVIKTVEDYINEEESLTSARINWCGSLKDCESSVMERAMK